MRIIIKCPESDLHLEAGYIYADCFFDNFEPLAVRRRTIHNRQLLCRIVDVLGGLPCTAPVLFFRSV